MQISCCWISEWIFCAICGSLWNPGIRRRWKERRCDIKDFYLVPFHSEKWIEIGFWMQLPKTPSPVQLRKEWKFAFWLWSKLKIKFLLKKRDFSEWRKMKRALVRKISERMKSSCVDSNKVVESRKRKWEFCWRKLQFAAPANLSPPWTFSFFRFSEIVLVPLQDKSSLFRSQVCCSVHGIFFLPLQE